MLIMLPPFPLEHSVAYSLTYCNLVISCSVKCMKSESIHAPGPSARMMQPAEERF